MRTLLPKNHLKFRSLIGSKAGPGFKKRREKHPPAALERRFLIAFLSTVIFLGPALVPAGLAQPASGQAASEDLKKNAPSVFLKSSLDPAYFQKEIAFVNYVQDEAEAQVFIEITSQTTGGGEEFTISLTGKKEFAGINDVLKFTADMSKKPEDAKAEVAKLLKLGLMRYVAKTPIAGRVNVAFMDQVKPTAVVDRWKFWVFSVGADAFINGEETYKMEEIFGNFSANRVTEEWKIRLSVSTVSMKNTFSVGDYNYESTMKSQYFSGLAVRSISDHWSVGAFVGVSSSTFNNTKLGLSLAPAIEYDLFPYSQSTKKQLRFLYRLNFNPVRYREETIYYKTKENLWSESLSAALELKQPWGTISTSLQGSHYFHDFKKYRLTLDGELSLRIFKGLNFNISGGGSRIRDQLSLVKGEASWEEVLLQRRQLGTGYNYYFSLGLSFTFGSTSSRVVNPRFGTGSGTSISISF
jgi:hypothetical protein